MSKAFWRGSGLELTLEQSSATSKTETFCFRWLRNPKHVSDMSCRTNQKCLSSMFPTTDTWTLSSMRRHRSILPLKCLSIHGMSPLAKPKTAEVPILSPSMQRRLLKACYQMPKFLHGLLFAKTTRLCAIFSKISFAANTISPLHFKKTFS